jgi:predicted permease
LLLASVNVGNLLLSRAIERGKETAIRVALGAPRLRLISQMLWESIIICFVGGLIGLLVLAWGLGIMGPVTDAFFLDRVSFWWQFGVDGYTLRLVFLVVFGTILVTGLLPAWKNSGSDFNSVLRDGTRGALGKKAGRLNRILVISEIFLSMIVLMVAGVILVGSYLLNFADYGVNPDGILSAEVQLNDANYDTSEKQVQFARTLQSRLETSEGIGRVMISTAFPGDYSESSAIAIDGNEYTQEGTSNYPRANYIAVMPDTLTTLGVELKGGRYFNSGDDGLDKGTVIVTESFVSNYLPNGSPIGKRIRLVDGKNDTANWLTIVGVVKHTVQGPANDARGRLPSVFRPFTQAPRQQMEIALQMKSDKAAVTRTLRETLSSIDPKLPAYRIETLAKKIDRHSAPLKFVSTLFLLFGIATVFLAASGIYGVLSNTINQRTQEIGIKRALGAMDDRITKEFLMTGFKQLLWGGVPGLLAGGAMGFGMSKVIGIGNDHLIIITITLLTIIGTVVMLATYLPTKRALQMEPSAALRHE